MPGVVSLNGSMVLTHNRMSGARPVFPAEQVAEADERDRVLIRSDVKAGRGRLRACLPPAAAIGPRATQAGSGLVL